MTLKTLKMAVIFFTPAQLFSAICPGVLTTCVSCYFVMCPPVQMRSTTIWWLRRCGTSRRGRQFTFPSMTLSLTLGDSPATHSASCGLNIKPTFPTAHPASVVFQKSGGGDGLPGRRGALRGNPHVLLSGDPWPLSDEALCRHGRRHTTVPKRWEETVHCLWKQKEFSSNAPHLVLLIIVFLIWNIVARSLRCAISSLNSFAGH